ncbi:hypothetical protein BH18VER2_BH18VER2_12960 [soil metagenome]
MPPSRQISGARTLKQRPDVIMKSDTRKTLYSFLGELVVYGILVVAYFFLVLHFLGDWLAHLNRENVKLYAVVAIGLIIGQAVVLESVTTLIFRLMRGRSE